MFKVASKNKYVQVLFSKKLVSTNKVTCNTKFKKFAVSDIV